MNTFFNTYSVKHMFWSAISALSMSLLFISVFAMYLHGATYYFCFVPFILAGIVSFAKYRRGFNKLYIAPKAPVTKVMITALRANLYIELQIILFAAGLVGSLELVLILGKISRGESHPLENLIGALLSVSFLLICYFLRKRFNKKTD